MESRVKTLLEFIEDYFAKLREKNRDGILALFEDTAVVRDPVGQNEFSGKSAIEQYLDDLFNTWFYYEARVDNYFPGGDHRLALRWSVSGTAMNNKTADFNGITFYAFSESTKFAVIETYWHFQRILDQIKNE